MVSAHVRWVRGGTLLTAVWLLTVLPLQADEPSAALREQVLKLNTITGTDPIEGQVRALVADEAHAKKLLAAARTMLAKDAKDPPINYNAALILATTARQFKDLPTSRAFYKHCGDQAVKLGSVYRLVQVYDGMIELFFDNKKYADAIKACDELLGLKGGKTLDGLKPFVLERKIQALAKEGKTDDALKMTDAIIKADEGGWYFVRLKGWVLREAGKLDEAAQTYEGAIDLLKKNEDMKEEQRERYADSIRYILSGVYVDQKKIDKAADQLKLLLKKKPDSPTFNNDLGFIWADHDMNLDEAEKLIRKAIAEDRKQRKADPDLMPEEDKDNAAYLDSLGWVLYKQKKYAEAKKYLSEAVEDKKEGQHIEIYDHLADVHVALKEKEAAIALWKKALALEPLGKRDEERKARIEKKLKAAQP